MSRKQILLRTIRWSSEGKSITERLPSPKYDRENTEISSILKRKKRKLQTERNESETRVELPKLKKIQSEEMTSGNFR